MRIELTTFRLWDWRAAYCAKEAHTRKNKIILYNYKFGSDFEQWRGCWNISSTITPPPPHPQTHFEVLTTVNNVNCLFILMLVYPPCSPFLGTATCVRYLVYSHWGTVQQGTFFSEKCRQKRPSGSSSWNHFRQTSVVAQEERCSPAAFPWLFPGEVSFQHHLLKGTYSKGRVIQEIFN